MQYVFNPHATGIRKLDWGKPETREKIWAAIDTFFGKCDQGARRVVKPVMELQKRVTELATDGQFPAIVNEKMLRFKVGQQEIDQSWRLIFREVPPAMLANRPNFTINDVQNMVTFAKVATGAPAKVFSLTGVQVTVTFDTYGATLNFPQQWYEDQDLWNINEAVVDFNTAWYNDQAVVMFALIEALTNGLYDGTTTGVDAGDGANVAYNSDTTLTQMERDILTINAGIISILDACKTKGYRVSATSPMVLLCNINRYDRLLAAVNARRGDYYRGSEIVNKNLTLVPTLHLATKGEWKGATTTDTASELPLGYLGLPGNKTLFLNKKPLAVDPAEYKSRNFSTQVSAWGRYGASLDTLSIRRLLASVTS